MQKLKEKQNKQKNKTKQSNCPKRPCNKLVKQVYWLAVKINK